MSEKQTIQNIEKYIEWFLLETSFSVKERGSRRMSDEAKKPRFKWYDPTPLIAGEWATKGEEYLPRDADGKALSKPLNYSMALRSSADRDGSFCIYSMRSATDEEWRGRPYCVDKYRMRAHEFNCLESTFDCKTLFIAKHGEALEISSIKDISPQFCLRPDPSKIFRPDMLRKWFEKTNILWVFFAKQFASEYFWHAHIGWDEHPKVRLPLTADRAMKLFQVRDKPTDSQRRSALIHWIIEHQRVVNRGEENERMVQVIPSIRGVYDFGWKGLNVSIYPPESLIRDAEKRSRISPSVEVQKERVDSIALM